MLFENAAAEYMADKSKRLRATTLEGYGSALRLHVLPRWCGVGWRTFISHPVKNLNDLEAGIGACVASTTNRPDDWGVAIAICDDQIKWKWQIALSATGAIYMRKDINRSGWNQWSKLH